MFLCRSKNTNVVKFYSLLKKDKTDEQICYYQVCNRGRSSCYKAKSILKPGIGTYFQPGVVSPFLRWWAAGLDMAIAWYLSQHVLVSFWGVICNCHSRVSRLDGYKFLMQNYNVGDKVCIFGVSWQSGLPWPVAKTEISQASREAHIQLERLPECCSRQVFYKARYRSLKPMVS